MPALNETFALKPEMFLCTDEDRMEWLFSAKAWNLARDGFICLILLVLPSYWCFVDQMSLDCYSGIWFICFSSHVRPFCHFYT